MGRGPSAKLLQPLRLPQKRQQVAAVCYRIRKRGIEFLLVQTRGGRWIFPKGGVEPGLTHAQSAALEAFEEAGVHGRMEEIPFARYFRSGPDTATTTRDTGSAARSSETDAGVAAHLCEVSRLEAPQESNRNPTWFSAEKAKQRLLDDRAPELGGELARIVDRALSRIQRLHSSGRHTPDRLHRDAMQEVRFEAHEGERLHDDLTEAALVRNFLRQRGGARSSAAIEIAVQAHLREIRRPVLRLGAGAGSTPETVPNLTAIDRGRRASLSKPGTPPSSESKARDRFVGARTERPSNQAHCHKPTS